MKKLIVALVLAIASCSFAPVPTFAADEHCVTADKFVSQNQEVNLSLLPIDVKPEMIELLLNLVPPLPPEAGPITEIRFFQIHPRGKPMIAGMAFGHEGLVCVYAFPPPQVWDLITQILENSESITKNGEKL